MKTNLFPVLLLLSLANCTTEPLNHPLDGGWWHGASLRQDNRIIQFHVTPEIEPFAAYMLDGASAWRSFGVTFETDESSPPIRCGSLAWLAGWSDASGITMNCQHLKDSYYTDAQKRRWFAYYFGISMGLQQLTDPEAVMGLSDSGTNSFNQNDVNEYYRVFSDENFR